MEQYVSYITLGSSDMSRSCGFYQNCLELPKLKSPPGVHFFSLGHTRLAIWSRESLATNADLTSMGTGFQGFCLSHNVRSHEEVDSLLSRVAAGGARLHDQPIRLTGVAMQDTSPTPMDSCGRSCITPSSSRPNGSAHHIRRHLRSIRL